MLIVTALVNIFLCLGFKKHNYSLIDERLTRSAENLNRYIESGAAVSKAAATSTAQRRDVIEAVREGDAAALSRIITPLRELYEENIFSVSDSDGTVLAGTHEQENDGGSNLYLQSVQDALNGSVTTCYERAPFVRISIQTGAPVYYGGRLIGVVSAGVRLDAAETVGELKRALNTEVTIYDGTKPIATTIVQEGLSADDMPMDEQAVDEVVKNKRVFYGGFDFAGTKQRGVYVPLSNPNSEVFATVLLSIPETEHAAASKRFMINGALFSIGALAAAAAFLFFAVSRASKPVYKLSEDMRRIAGGNLSVSIEAAGEDEMSLLGKSLQKVRDTLHRLSEDVSIMIAEQEKGNIEYRLAPGEFNGDYRALAGNILELAELGMSDSLTGLANRRSFNNRLELEWNRARREKTPLSALFVDIDDFKTYNDAFGHQQGDAALRTTASAIKNALKRSVDLAARYDGEEFVVLLPSTDKRGALIAAENIRAAVESAIIPSGDKAAANLTVSVGVSTRYPAPDADMNGLVAEAGAALLNAKGGERNRVY